MTPIWCCFTIWHATSLRTRFLDETVAIDRRSVVAPRRIIRNSNLFTWLLIIIERCPGECTLLRDRPEIKMARRCLSPHLGLAQFRAPHRGNRGVSTYALANSLEQGFPFLYNQFSLWCLKLESINQRSNLFRQKRDKSLFTILFWGNGLGRK